MSGERVSNISASFDIDGVEKVEKGADRIEDAISGIGETAQETTEKIEGLSEREIRAREKAAKEAERIRRQQEKDDRQKAKDAQAAADREDRIRRQQEADQRRTTAETERLAEREIRSVEKVLRETEKAARGRAREADKAVREAERAAKAAERTNDREAKAAAAAVLKAAKEEQRVAQAAEKAATKAAAAEAKAAEKAAKETERSAKAVERAAERKAKAEAKAAEKTAAAAAKMNARLRSGFAATAAKATALATAIGGIGAALGLIGFKKALDSTVEDLKVIREIAALTNSDVSEISFLQQLGAQSGIDNEDLRGILSGSSAAFTEAVRDPNSEFGKAIRDAGIQLTVTPQLDRKEFERQWRAAQVDLTRDQRKMLDKERRDLLRYRDEEGRPLTPERQQKILDQRRISLGKKEDASDDESISKFLTRAEAPDVLNNFRPKPALTDKELAEETKLVSDALDDATEETEALERAFRAAQPPAKAFVDQFLDLATATSRMGQAEKGRFLSQLLGDDDSAKVAELLDTIASNRERLGPLYRELLEKDQLVTDAQVETAKEYQKQTGVLSQAIKTVQRLYFVRVAPEVGRFFDTFTKFLVTNSSAIVDYLERGTRTALDFAHDLVEVFTDLDVDPSKGVRFTWLQDLKDGIPGAIQSMRDFLAEAQAFGRDVGRAFAILTGGQTDDPEAETRVGGWLVRMAAAAGPAVQFVLERIDAMVEGVKARFTAVVDYVTNAWTEAKEAFDAGEDGLGLSFLGQMILEIREILDLVDRFRKAFRDVFIDRKDKAPPGFEWMVRLREVVDQLDEMFKRLGDAFDAVVKPILDGIDAITKGLNLGALSVYALGLAFLNSLTGGAVVGGIKALIGLLTGGKGLVGGIKAAIGALTGTAGLSAAAGTATTAVGAAATTATTTAATAATTVATGAATTVSTMLATIARSLSVWVAGLTAGAAIGWYGTDALLGSWLQRRNDAATKAAVEGPGGVRDRMDGDLDRYGDKRASAAEAERNKAADAEARRKAAMMSGGYDFSQYQTVGDVRTYDFGGPPKYQADALSSFDKRQSRFDLNAAQIEAANVALDGKIDAANAVIDAKNSQITTDLVPVNVTIPGAGTVQGLYTRDQADALRLALDNQM